MLWSSNLYLLLSDEAYRDWHALNPLTWSPLWKLTSLLISPLHLLSSPSQLSHILSSAFHSLFSFVPFPHSPSTLYSLLPPYPLSLALHIIITLSPFLFSLFLPQLLQKDPKKRLTIEQAFAHPFLQQNFEFSSPKAEASLEVVRTCVEDATILHCHRQAVSILIDPSWWWFSLYLAFTPSHSPSHSHTHSHTHSYSLSRVLRWILWVGLCGCPASRNWC